QYNRIEFGTVDLDVSVISHAVNDVVRLVAELLDNATRFSPPDSAVLVDGRRIGDYVLVQIEDRGLGLPAEQLAAVNERLAEPPTVDVSAFRMMGLAVVSRLASRYRIKVELRPNPDGGTITGVTLPTSILVLPRPVEPMRYGPPAPPPVAAPAPVPVQAQDTTEMPIFRSMEAVWFNPEVPKAAAPPPVPPPPPVRPTAQPPVPPLPTRVPQQS